MRIAVDAHVIGEQETGNETYTRNLLRALAQDPGGDAYQLLTPHPDRLRAALTLPPAMEVVTVRPAASILRIPFGMPAAIRRQRSQVLHVSYVAPPRLACPTVVTIHDLSYLAYPHSVSTRTRLILTTLVPRSVRQAARVIAVSDFTRKDLIARYGMDADRIAVVHEAAGSEFRRLPDAGRRPLPGGVREPFVLAVGNLEPRKNLARLVEAFGGVARRDPAPTLVLVGKAKGSDSGLSEAIARHAPGRVVRVGFVSDDELVLLYNRAALFIYPSLYEGFGLPPLEAMACGCPVIASNVTAMPEILGDGALLVDPLSPAAMAEAIRAVLDRQGLAADLRAHGMRQAASYSWARAAKETRAVYAQAGRAAVPAPPAA
ncbi:MAG TPA: glycosyltransferase family 1 protein [Candidatus Sulfotelmatobacter sp.]|nr:glycosyltransferase family 1 protein [Candidatus Sulfotelmatobacter sp.]